MWEDPDSFTDGSQLGQRRANLCAKIPEPGRKGVDTRGDSSRLLKGALLTLFLSRTNVIQCVIAVTPSTQITQQIAKALFAIAKQGNVWGETRSMDMSCIF